MLKHPDAAYVPFLIALVTFPSCRKPATPVLPTSSDLSSPKAMTLADAIKDWIRLLETDDLQNASKRWTKNDEARKQLERFWPKLRACNQAFDYRKWLDEATKAEGNGAFTIGGHQYGFMYTDWVATPLGWRIQSVWMCR